MRAEVVAFAAHPADTCDDAQLFSVHHELMLSILDEVRRLRAEKAELMSEVVERVERNVKRAYGLVSDLVVERLDRDVESKIIHEAMSGFDDAAYCADLEAGLIDVPMTDAAIAKLCKDVMAAPDLDDAHYELVMPFVVVESVGGPFDDAAYCAGWEAGTIDVKLMALSAFGQSATDLVCVEANWPQVSLILMKHGWNVDESSMSIADGWVSVKVVGF